MPQLTELLHAVTDIESSKAPTVSIENITADSRDVKPGALYVAIKGTATDGAQFIPQAVKAGAVAVLCENGVRVDGAVAIHSANVRRSLAQIAAAFYAKQPAHIVAITGTDGKTSTADFYRQFMHHLGKSSASIGTLGIFGGDGKAIYPESQTTPGPVQLHKILAELADKKVTHVAMEASSHGLDQFRLDAVKLEAAAFTNIARDHLDYHASEEEYFKAKARLFGELLPAGKTAVLNQDDKRFPALAEMCKKSGAHVVGFGKNGEHFCIDDIKPKAHGQAAQITIYGKPYTLDIPVAGAFQVFNIVAALALCEASGESLEKALAVIPKLKGVQGRLEHIATLANGATVFIDYAHTPMALANILRTLRPHAAHKLHVVFGCGGNRDAGKRPEMGRLASDLADRVIVTDDNPRKEEPAAIRRAIMAACPKGQEIGDRREAIYAALRGLQTGDVLVVAGKGHEKTQTVGDTITPFDDAEVIRDGVKELRLAA